MGLMGLIRGVEDNSPVTSVELQHDEYVPMQGTISDSHNFNQGIFRPYDAHMRPRGCETSQLRVAQVRLGLKHLP